MCGKKIGEEQGAIPLRQFFAIPLRDASRTRKIAARSQALSAFLRAGSLTQEKPRIFGYHKILPLDRITPS
jgi:hypothetical protein